MFYVRETTIYTQYSAIISLRWRLHYHFKLNATAETQYSNSREMPAVPEAILLRVMQLQYDSQDNLMH